MPRSRSGRSAPSHSRSYSTGARTAARPSARNSARAPQTQRKPATTSSTHKSTTAAPSHASAPKPAAPASNTSTPAPQPPQYSQPYQRSGFLGTMAEGFAFGAGSAVAHNAVNGVVNAVTGRNRENPSNAPVPVEETQSAEEPVQNEDPCMLQRMDFNNCLQVNADKGISECQIFFDSFKRCQERVKMENMNRFE